MLFLSARLPCMSCMPVISKATFGNLQPAKLHASPDCSAAVCAEAKAMAIAQGDAVTQAFAQAVA